MSEKGSFARSVLKSGLLGAGALAAFAGCSADSTGENVVRPEPPTEAAQDLQGENLSGSNLAGTNLGGSNLAGTNLGGSNLGGSNLGGSNLGGSNLAGTNLGGNNLGGSNLGGSNLGGSNLAGTNLGGSNLGGSNLGGSNLGGSNLAGTNLGGSNLAGTNLGGSNLAGTNSGANIHGLSGSINGMLYSGEDLWKPDGTNRGQCIVMGLGSTAFPKLLGQQSANAKISVALGKLPWGFASTAGGSVTLSAWEAVVWGDSTYCTFVLAAPPSTNWMGVAGFIKGVFRWNAPTTQSMDISGIEASAPYDSTLQTTVYNYPGMMNAGAQWRSGNLPAASFITGELGFVSATTNNQSVMVDFSSWVRDKNGNAIVLGNVQSTSPPTYAESVYIAIDNGDGTAGVLIDDAGANWWDGVAMPTGMMDSTADLDGAYQNYKRGGPKPVPLRCGGALYLNANYGEAVPAGKCDNGVIWPSGGCISGSQPWTSVSGTTAPMNTYMVLTQPGGAYSRATDTSCNLHPVISETYVHMWSPNYSLPSSFTVDDMLDGRANHQFNYAGSWGYYVNDTNGSPYKSTYSQSKTANDSVSFKFYGTQVKLYGVKGPTGGIGAVSLDGGAESNVDFYASARTGNAAVWTSPVLGAGNHTVKLRVTGTKNASSSNAYVIVDRADVTNSPSIFSYEGEASGNTLSGAAAVGSCTGCSGATRVRNIGSNTSNYVVVNGVNAPATGTYTLKVYAVVSGTRSFSVSVNGGTATSMSFTGPDWNTPIPVQQNVSLNAGSNTIKLFNNGAWAPDLDRITVENACLAETDAVFCSRLGASCGSITANDNCGNSRTVSSCGSCTSPQTCGGGGSANVCGSGGPVSGQTYKLVGKGSSKCLDVPGASTSNGALMEIWTCNGSAAQNFTAVSLGGGAYKLVNPNGGKCLDVPGYSTSAGTQLEEWDCTGGDNQAFTVQSVGGGYYSLTNVYSGLCVDVDANATGDGTVVQQWDCNTSDAQAWKFQ